ncbi:MAG TPA: four-helix bundle copper-binding protein [Longimicrobiales bacterium]|nr:four-helix bundle copper-binding protein [Longimicrobiales bacterium]
MTRLTRMMESHPHPAGSNGEQARRCIEACAECAQTCTVCADACLAERNVQKMVNCIRLNLDCADVCHVTGTLMTRPSHRDAPALRAQLEACLEICRACADECDHHAPQMEHCRICAEACRACADACEQMMGALVP